MDVLAEVITSVRAGRADACWVRQSGPWGLRFSGLQVSGFHIMMRGTAWLLTATGEPRALVPGDVILAPSGAEHGLSHTPSRLGHLLAAVLGPDPGVDGEWDAEFLCGAYWLEHGQVPHYLRALPEIIVASTGDDPDPQLRALVDLLAADVSDTGPGTGATRPALLDLVLTRVLRRWLEQNHSAALPDTSDPAIAAVLHAVHAAPQEPWTLDRLSTIAGLSRRTFTTRFHTVLGQSPMAYVTAWRLSHAALLLRETSAPLAAVARRVGYGTEFAFGAAFRRAYGISPGRFRAD
ncbi:AraC family transcriptional regulator [Catenuloplanes japonicus]|uniref:AraC family transcriptional regulator n=1 Tax=Catenuloplanes japonicus TaxID=33876 RepID=UPI00052491C2|nr:AraC family transcriptional regulator [Catenuloplanes japonicus]